MRTQTHYDIEIQPLKASASSLVSEQDEAIYYMQENTTQQTAQGIKKENHNHHS
jgi:hypothetical protein